ncbi:MAG TPA: hypothetical protein VJ924_11895 [Alphaproteobacteria bacterium]|nr:hypothetical protein [Alphaproteobacteria bacterium]
MSARTAFACIAVSTIVACGPKPEVPTPEEIARWQRIADTEILCNVGIDCEIKWGRALEWMRDFGPKRLTTANERLIEGQFGRRSYPGARYVVTRVYAAPGIQRITFLKECPKESCITAPFYSTELSILLTRYNFARVVLNR